MGAFNELETEVRCTVCGKRAMMTIQFRYGAVWQYKYGVGDELRWGRNDVGESGAGHVRVSGCGGPCPHCGGDAMEFSIAVESDRIVSVEETVDERLADPEVDFVLG